MGFPEGKKHNKHSIHLNEQKYSKDAMEGSGFVLSLILIAKLYQPVHCGISTLIVCIFLPVLSFTF